VDDGTYEALLQCPTCLPGYPCIPCHYVYVKTNPATDGVVDRYTAVVITANDYYPFGMLMPGRKYSADGSYRYGFNGKENDNEVKGEGNQQDYGMRIYDPRLGRFLSVDPIARNFPMLTPFQFAANTPISAIDLDGLESAVVTVTSISSAKSNSVLKVQFDMKRIAEKASLRSAAIDWIIPQLKMPTWRQTSYGLTEVERSRIVRETVSAFLTFNFTENISHNFDGKKIKTQSLEVELNTELLFGAEHATEKSLEIRELFNLTAQALGYFSEATDEAIVESKVLTGIDLAIDLVEKDYESLTLKAVEILANKAFDYAIDKGIKSGLLPATASFIGARFVGLVTNVLTPLELAKGSSTSEVRKAQSAFETKTLNNQTISALLFYFINGNKFENIPKREIVPANESRAKNDNTRNVNIN
jgi:RHS repeat-associated protein